MKMIAQKIFEKEMISSASLGFFVWSSTLSLSDSSEFWEVSAIVFEVESTGWLNDVLKSDCPPMSGRIPWPYPERFIIAKVNMIKMMLGIFFILMEGLVNEIFRPQMLNNLLKDKRVDIEGVFRPY